MSTYLQGVQLLHAEAKLPGPAPQAVTGLSGRAADLARWYAQAYIDIQLENDGHWKWLRTPFAFPTAPHVNSYLITVTGCGARLGQWHLSDTEPPLIFKVSEGQSTQGALVIDGSWAHFRNCFLVGTPTEGPPRWCALGPDDRLYLASTPDAIYQINGDYWHGPQVLAANDDVPEMPARFHPLIVYRALMKYGYNTVSNDTLARVQAEYQPMYGALEDNQGHAKFSLLIGPPLA